MTPRNLVEAVIWQESRGNPDAVSPVGARGLMQIMPDTARQPGFGIQPVDPNQLFDPDVNRRFGEQYLGAMLSRYGGDTRRALAAYNWGAGNADKWDGDMSKLPKETRDYITNIEGRVSGGEGSDAMAGGGSSFFDSYLAESTPKAGQNAGGSSFFDSYMSTGDPETPPPAPAPTYDGYADGTMRAVTDGVYLGYGDNVGAAIGAVVGADPESGEFFDYSRSMGDRYDANLELERRKRAGFAEENPITDTVAKVGGAAVSTALAAGVAPIKAAATTGGRVVQAMGGGGVVGGVTASGEADGPDESRLIAGGAGTVLGAVGGLIGIPVAAVATKAAKLVGKGAARIFTSPKTFSPETGKLTEEGARRLQAMGFNPDAISKQLAESFEAEAKAATAPAAAANSFGIPLTKGQATGDIPQIATEEASRAGARGQGAYDVLKGFDDRQSAAVGAARETLVPNPSKITASDVGDVAIPAVKQAAAKAKAGARQAYDIFEAQGGGVKGESVKRLAGDIVRSLKAEALDIDPSLTNANAAIERLQKMFGGADRGAVPFAQIERARQMLRRASSAAAKGSNGADGEAMRVIMKTYDDWLEGAVDTALSDGSADALAQVKKARGLWGDYLKTFTGKNGADNYIRKIVEDEIAPDQVAGWLFGASKNIGGGQTALIAKKLRGVLGADSPEFNMIRQAAWDRLTMKADTPRGVADMESALREFTTGKGKNFAKELFTPDELKRIGEFRMALSALKVPQKAGNPSGSGYEASRAVMGLAKGTAAAIGLQAGGPGGAVAASMGPQIVANFRNTLAAKAATRGITGPAPSLSGAIGLGGSAGASGYERGKNALQGL